MSHPAFARPWLTRRSAAFLLVLIAASFGGWRLSQSRRSSLNVQRRTRSVMSDPRVPRAKELVRLSAARSHSGAMAFSPDGKTLALPKHRDGRVELFNLESGKLDVLVSSANTQGLGAEAVSYSKDGRFLAVYYVDLGLIVWNITAKSERPLIPLPRPRIISDLAVTSDCSNLVALTRNTSFINRRVDRAGIASDRWDALSGRSVGRFEFETARWSKGLSPDGRYAVLDIGQDTGVVDLASGEKAFNVLDDNCGFCFSGDSSSLVSYNGRKVRIVGVPSGMELKQFALETSFLIRSYEVVDCLALSPDAKLLAIGWFGETNRVGVVSLVSGKLLDTFECGPPLTFCDRIVFSPDGRILVTDTQVSNMNDAEIDPLLKFWQLPTSW